MDEVSLRRLLAELKGETSSDEKHDSQAAPDSQIELLMKRLEQVERLKQLYSVLKRVVEPEPCPLLG